MKREDARAFEQYCVLRIGAKWFALPAVSVREVAGCDAMVTLPGPGPVSAGLCHMRNEFLPVLRWHSMGDGGLAVDGAEQLLVLSGPNGCWGLLVDEVAALASLEVSMDTDLRFAEGWMSSVMGSATFRDKVVRVLDPNRFYRAAEQMLARQWQSATSQNPIGNMELSPSESPTHQGAMP